MDPGYTVSGLATKSGVNMEGGITSGGKNEKLQSDVYNHVLDSNKMDN